MYVFFMVNSWFFFLLQLKAAVLNSDLELLQEIVVQFDIDLPEFR